MKKKILLTISAALALSLSAQTVQFRGDNRCGIYYAEKGASQRASKVIYDRAHSSFQTSEPSDYNWEEIFKDADWFHFTGITPAVGGKLPEICLEACKAAKAKGITISCDLNYRKKLWTREQANKVTNVFLSKAAFFTHQVAIM